MVFFKTRNSLRWLLIHFTDRKLTPEERYARDKQMALLEKMTSHVEELEKVCRGTPRLVDAVHLTCREERCIFNRGLLVPHVA